MYDEKHNINLEDTLNNVQEQKKETLNIESLNKLDNLEFEDDELSLD